MNTVIDFNVIAEQADLPTLMSRAGVEVRNGKALCPFHDNSNTPAMTVFRIGGRWRFDCKACGAKGDAIGFVSQWDRITPIEAALKLGGVGRDDVQSKAPGVLQERPPRVSTGLSTPNTRTLSSGAYKPPPDLPGPWADAEWQDVADEIICRAEERLWSPAGRDALEWLRTRGLLDFTIRRFRLGFIAERESSDPIKILSDGDRPGGITAHRGITLPWCHPNCWYQPNEPTPGPRWVGCNVRRLMPDVFDRLPDHEEKCFAFKGSRRGFAYPFADFAPGVPALLVEGEWDALVAWQEFGSVLNVVSVGGAKQEPKPSALDALSICPNWLVALHNDKAGNEGAKKWSICSGGKSVRAMLPSGRDLNDMHLDGEGRLREWIRSEYDTLGWSWPLPPR